MAFTSTGITGEINKESKEDVKHGKNKTKDMVVNPMGEKELEYLVIYCGHQDYLGCQKKNFHQKSGWSLNRLPREVVMVPNL